jgi:hypothetical protein
MTTKDKVEKRIRELLPETGLNLEDDEDWSFDNKIHLETILMAIEKVGGNYISISTKGEFYRVVELKKECIKEKYLIDYDLSKDFNNQSQEFYQFLLNILEK